jgi:uncharacterized protein (TIGR03032 family)
VSTYQAGKVALLGWSGRQVSLLMRQFDKPLGLAVHGDRVALATRNEVVFFANASELAPHFLEDQPGRYDALYLPRVSYHTGDMNIHDVAFVDGELWVVNTRFSCLARLSHDFNFVPVWKPDFISELTPEDRCHLNGVALRDGRPKYVTALGATNTGGGWRSNKATGGVVIDVETSAVVASGLSMPHSPRWHEGRLWALNSGTGDLIVVDPQTGRVDVVCQLPGYLRGLCFVGPYAVVGLCRIRERHIFGGLPVQERWDRLACGLVIVDAARGVETARFEFTAGCEELYDVQYLPGVFRPMILNWEQEAARQAVSGAESSYWLRPSSEIRDPVSPEGARGATWPRDDGVVPSVESAGAER